MNNGFKMRHGVETCADCGIDESRVMGEHGCSRPSYGTNSCPFKDREGTPEAFEAKVRRLRLMYGQGEMT